MRPVRTAGIGCRRVVRRFIRRKGDIIQRGMVGCCHVYRSLEVKGKIIISNVGDERNLLED